jgi:hypothetical protein
MSPQLAILAFCLFLAGLGLLLFVFLRLLLKPKKQYSRKKSSFKGRMITNGLIIGGGVVLILLAQNLLWLNSRLNVYFPLYTNAPIAKISFVESEYEKPRMILKTYDENNNPLIASEIILEDTLFQIEMQVIRFKKLGNLLGLHELYRFTQLSYISSNPDHIGEIRTTHLVDPDKPVIDYINNVNKIMSIATHKTVFSDPLVLDSSQVVEITYNDLGTIDMMSFENSHLADGE